MELIFDFIEGNLALSLTLLAMLLGAVLYGSRRLWFMQFNETLFFLFDGVEKRGLIAGWSGKEKLEKYLNAWREVYEKQFNDEIPEPLIKYATDQAAKMAEKEKDIKTLVSGWSNPK